MTSLAPAVPPIKMGAEEEKKKSHPVKVVSPGKSWMKVGGESVW